MAKLLRLEKALFKATENDHAHAVSRLDRFCITALPYSARTLSGGCAHMLASSRLL